jgi:hypothetical protein
MGDPRHSSQPVPGSTTRVMDDRWLYLEGRRDGHAYTAGVRLPFDPALWPSYDHHVAISVDYAAHWRTGLPKPEELPRLQGFEDRMIAGLDAHGVLVASETGDRRRTIHVFIRGGGLLLEMYRDWESRGKQGGVAVSVAHDPEWLTVAHLAECAARAA